MLSAISRVAAQRAPLQQITTDRLQHDVANDVEQVGDEFLMKLVENKYDLRAFLESYKDTINSNVVNDLLGLLGEVEVKYGAFDPDDDGQLEEFMAGVQVR